MHYAVNLYDLMSLNELDPVGALLFPPSGLGDIINAELHRVGGDAAVLNFGDERAEAVVQLVRMKYQRYKFRLYKSKTGNGGWKRV